MYLNGILAATVLVIAVGTAGGNGHHGSYGQEGHKNKGNEYSSHDISSSDSRFSAQLYQKSTVIQALTHFEPGFLVFAVNLQFRS